MHVSDTGPAAVATEQRPRPIPPFLLCASRHASASWYRLAGAASENGGYMTAQRILSWSPPSAVVFDCDGTLMDTERHWQEARNITFRLFGLTPARRVRRTREGRSLHRVRGA